MSESKYSKIRILSSSAEQAVCPGWYRFTCTFDYPGIPPYGSLLIELPNPPVKSDGQKAYEAGPTPSIPWADLAAHYRNQYHTMAAAVTGKPPVVEKEPEPVKSAGERFFLAYLNGGAWPSNWRTMPELERQIWEARSAKYERGRP